MELLFILGMFSIVSCIGFYSLISAVKELKSEVNGLRLCLYKNKEKNDDLADLITECQDQALNRIEVIEKLLDGFCMMKLPTIEEQDKLYQKIKRDITDFKKSIASQERKLDKSVQDFDKRLKGSITHIASIDSAMQSIKRETIDDFNEYRDMVEQEIIRNNDKVFGMVRDIARDFHVLACKLQDGSFKEIKIMSESEYIKLRKIPQ